MIFAILPFFMSNILMLNMATIGIIEGIAESLSSLIKLFSGWVSDKIHKRKIFVTLGYGLSTISKAFLLLQIVH